MNKKGRIVSVQDVLYGSITFTPLLMKVMDSPYFQRLARHLQLGVCHYVYPGATHTRKSHCMGASHLAGVWMRHLQKQQPELHITKRMIELVRLAALLHDVGHTFYSHLFDHEVAPLLDIPRKDHEDRSVHLLRIIAKESEVGLTEQEIDVVAAMIKGEPPKGTHWPNYLFQIVAADIDVDKMDYLRRDSYFTGVPCGFQSGRLIQSSRVIDGELCFSRKVARNILQMFHTRYYFHSEIYQHKTAMILTAMLSDAIRLAIPHIGLEEYFRHDTRWCELDDFSVRTLILRCNKAKKSHEILRRIERRDFYRKRVVDTALKSPSKGKREHGDDDEEKHTAVKKRRDNKGEAQASNVVVLEDKGIIVSTVGYLNENVNPLTRLWFFAADHTKKIRLPNWSAVMPTNFAEKRLIEFERT